MRAGLGVASLIGMSLLAGCGWFDDGSGSEVRARVASVEAQMQSRDKASLEPGNKFLSISCQPQSDSRFACREILAAKELEQQQGQLDPATERCLNQLALERSSCSKRLKREAEESSRTRTTQLQFFYRVSTDDSGRVVRSESAGYLPIPSLAASRRALPEEFQDLAR